MQLSSEELSSGSSDRRATLVYIEQTIIDSDGRTSNFKVARYKSDANSTGSGAGGGEAAASKGSKAAKEPLLIYGEIVDDRHPIQWPLDHSPILDLLKVGLVFVTTGRLAVWG